MITSYATLDPDGDDSTLNNNWKLYMGGEWE